MKSDRQKQIEVTVFGLLPGDIIIGEYDSKASALIDTPRFVIFVSSYNTVRPGHCVKYLCNGKINEISYEAESIFDTRLNYITIVKGHNVTQGYIVLRL